MQEMIDHEITHQKRFSEMISRVHHEGIVPTSASALGLTYVISLETAQYIIALQKLQDAQDWRTHSITSGLSRLMIEEIFLLEVVLKELNNEARETANEYHNHTFSGHPDNSVEY